MAFLRRRRTPEGHLEIFRKWRLRDSGGDNIRVAFRHSGRSLADGCAHPFHSTTLTTAMTTTRREQVRPLRQERGSTGNRCLLKTDDDHPGLADLIMQDRAACRQ